MTAYDYVIIGGGMAGGRACDGIRRIDATGSIVLVTAESHRPYERPPLSKGYLAGKEGLDKVYLKDEAEYAESGIDLITGVRAREVDAASSQVTLADGRTLEYGKLLLATGGRARRLALSGGDLDGMYTLRTIGDADAIRRRASESTQVVVLGGSFIGSEVAATLCTLGLQVTMVFPESRLLERVVAPELSEHLRRTYAERGVTILTGTKPASFAGAEAVERVDLDDGQSLRADLVVMGVGIELDTGLAEAAGLDLDERKAVMVNEYLETSAPDIYAAGDIASWPNAVFGKRLRVEHWDVARSQGLRAGRNMAGEGKPYRTTPYFFSDLFDLSFEAWGDLSSWDRTVLRGRLGSKFAYFCFAEQTLTGVLAVGVSRAERKAMPSIIKARLSYDEAEAVLRDEDADLTTLAG